MKSLKKLEETKRYSIYKCSQSISSIDRVRHKIDFLGEGIPTSDETYSNTDTIIFCLSDIKRT